MVESVVEDAPEVDPEVSATEKPKRRRLSFGLGWLRRFRLRRLLQFRLTTLLWMVVVISILFAWRRDRQLLIEQFRNREANWGTDQVIGEPDTPGYGDIPTAWASATQDGQKEWLVLKYDKRVTPKHILIHESYNPGAVYQVGAFDRLGIEHVVWKGIDPTPQGSNRGVSKIPIPAKFKTNRIKVYINSPMVPGWNEIDAVGLVDTWGGKQWASDATASSSYAAQFQFRGGLSQFPLPFGTGATQPVTEEEELLETE